MQFGRILLGMLLLGALLSIMGCTAKTVIQTPVKSQVFKTGGQLVYGSLQEPNTLNPLLSDFLATAEVSSLIFSGLVATNDKGEWFPDLALAVPTIENGGVSADGRTVSYKLRQGVNWHDGRQLTAEDVIFTWETYMNRRVNVVSREGYDRILSVTALNPYTVVVKFREYYAPYLTLFSTILPKHLLENSEDINKAPFNRAPIGTGPFRFKEWRIAEEVVLEANPGYFRGKPVLEGIIYKIVPDSSVLLNQIKLSSLDIVSNIGLAQLEQIKVVEGVRTIITPNMIWEHLDFNLDNALFQDVRVRQAIARCIDRQAMLDTVLKNAASPAMGDQSALSWAYNSGVVFPARDINAARNLLMEAGWKPGADGIFMKDGHRLAFSITTTAGNKIREAIGQLIVQQLKEVGIMAEIRMIEVQPFFDDVLKNRHFEAAMYAWTSSGDPDNMNLWHSKNIPGRGNGYEGQNYPGWRNPQVDALTEQGVHAVDLKTRQQAYFRIQELLKEECPVIPLYFRANIDAVKDNVINYRPNATLSGNLWNAWEWKFISK